MSSVCAASVGIRVRNLHEGEAATLPSVLTNTGMTYLVPEWVWVVEAAAADSTASSATPSAPFALLVTSFCHGWLVLWRLIAISPLPAGIPLTWFMEAIPQVFAEAQQRGCVGFLTLLADNRPVEAQIARIITQATDGKLLPFQGLMGVGMLAEVAARAGSDARTRTGTGTGKDGL